MICPRDDDVFYGREFHLLDKGERFNLDSHLSGCPKCAERAEQLTRRLHCLKLLPEIEPSPGLADRVLERIHAFDRWRRRVYLICLAGMLLLGATLIVMLMLLAQNKAEHRFLRDLEHQLQIYRNTHGVYPPADRPLSESISIPRDRLDAHGRVLDRWGRPLHYTLPGRHNKQLFDLQSYGRNGRDDGGEKDDITNW